MKSGIFIPLLILWPNLLWFLLRKQDSDQQPAPPIPRWQTLAENLGRLGALVWPVFSTLRFDKAAVLPVMGFMGLCLLIYYLCWLRYFRKDFDQKWLGRPFLGIPLPMALAPILLLSASSYLIDSWPMLGISLFFGFFHIWISARTLV